MNEYIQWVSENHLARASRPAYPNKDVLSKDVQGWINKVKSMHVRSIICLLKEDQLNFYRQVPGGLLAYYRKQGFEVVNVPISDPAHDAAGFEELEAALDTIYDLYQRLPKPVLIHCSAGIDRTGRIIDEIRARGSMDANKQIEIGGE